MIDHTLRVALCRSITARAHLAGAESADLAAKSADFYHQWCAEEKDPSLPRKAMEADERAAATRRRYWREQAACELLHGRRWPEAEALGVEPPAPVVISQED